MKKMRTGTEPVCRPGTGFEGLVQEPRYLQFFLLPALHSGCHSYITLRLKENLY